MLLPFTGLPCPRTRTPEKDKKVEKQQDLEDNNRVEVEESEYRDSSQSSAEEEDTRAEPYVAPERHATRHRGNRGQTDQRTKNTIISRNAKKTPEKQKISWLDE